MTLISLGMSFLMVLGGISTYYMLKYPGGKGIVRIELKDKLVGTKLSYDEQKGLEPVIKIADADGNGFCSGYVADDHYIVTAAHCLKIGGSHEMRENLTIVNEAGEIVAEATAAGINLRIDVGILHGDFKKFKKLPSEFYQDGLIYSYPTHHYMSCGYPYGQKEEVCTPFYPSIPRTDMMFGFVRSGISTMIPGMSGGPVINTSTGKVVGVNVGGTLVGSIIAPVLGLPAAFDIEP